MWICKGFGSIFIDDPSRNTSHSISAGLMRFSYVSWAMKACRYIEWQSVIDKSTREEKCVAWNNMAKLLQLLQKNRGPCGDNVKISGVP
jgi:hypothetical protein